MIKINKKYYVLIIILGIIVIIIFFFIKPKEDYEYIDTNKVISDSELSETLEDNITDAIKEEKIKIHILGEVNYNGILELTMGSRISDAIEKAGGLKASADVSKINLAYILEDGEKLYIPSINDKEDVEYLLSEKSGSNKININTAKLEELQNIPGVGPSIAQAIIDYREENGKFMNIEDIKSVSGVGESKYKKMEEYIKVK